MNRGILSLCAICSGLQITAVAAGQKLTAENPLQLPPVGACQLQIITPTLLELTRITAPSTDKGIWNFVDGSGQLHAPDAREFEVSAGARTVPVSAVGFRRRAIYAPLRESDLRVGNYLYLQLTSGIADGEAVTVRNPDGKLWPADMDFSARADPLRWSPALHVNQTGYLADGPKRARVGFYLGNLGEMDIGKPGQGEPEFHVLESGSGKEVFHGQLAPCPEQGFPGMWYQKVCEADFTPLKIPGEYRLSVPGLGMSYPFYIGDAVAGAFARTYALGIYHQRCGMANELPFTRFTHGACHTAPAEVPDMSSRFDFVNECLGRMTADFKDNPRHVAPQLKNVAASLYPFVNRGPVDVHGGHHDAGDYSKYTINSAAFIHYLVFAADVFPGVSALDNLGLPESGDGKSDVLEEVKWEADFLARMQDADGGFYFLVYPREREYENDVTPDHGDPQIVFPKNTAATAAATAALAQCASSPEFKREFPGAAAQYLAAAKRGWDFLQRAIARNGMDGAYQKITHYGDDFMHDDELAWAACEMFLATGDPAYQQKLIDWLHPADPATRRWGWWRLYSSYGCAIRSYAFAVKSGRVKPEQLDRQLREDCEAEIDADGEDQLRRAEQCAYGTSFPEETKRAGSAGWYFSGDAAFDLAVACQLDYPVMNDPRAKMFAALISNLDYEQGCNPVNVTYLTGLGWKRQREIVDQYSQNCARVLPPSGIPLGSIQSGFGWTDRYKKEPEELTFPADDSADTSYPLYDRWSDAFNLSQEFVIVNQARGLGYLAWLMARTPLKTQPWKSAEAHIVGTPTNVASGTRVEAKLSAPGLDLTTARIVWEARNQQPVFGQTFSFAPRDLGDYWIEAEAQLPDGRRAFAVTEFRVK